MSKATLKWALCTAVLGLVAVGCDEKKDAPVTPKVVAPAPVETPAPVPAPTMTDTATKTMDGAKETAAGMMDGAKGMATDAQTKATDATAGVNAMSAETETMAKDMIAKVEAFIKENKLDDASNMLTKLEEMKAKLPQNLQDQIAKLRPMLEAAKNMKMPAMPGMK